MGSLLAGFAVQIEHVDAMLATVFALGPLPLYALILAAVASLTPDFAFLNSVVSRPFCRLTFRAMAWNNFDFRRRRPFDGCLLGRLLIARISKFRLCFQLSLSHVGSQSNRGFEFSLSQLGENRPQDATRDKHRFPFTVQTQHVSS